MIIEYQIKRFDLVKVFLYNLRHSRRTQFIIFGVTTFVILYSLFLRHKAHSNLGLFDFIAAFLIGLGFILLIPALSFLTAKTQKRTLSINQEYIETKIGSKEAKISWKAVDSIVVTKDRIFITGKNANAFTIPASAFASDDLRNNFILLATQYHGDAKNSTFNMK